MNHLPKTDRARPHGPTHRYRLVVALTASACLTFVACSDDSTNLAALAEETFESEAVWRGDERYVTVTITEANFQAIVGLEIYLDELGFSPAVMERMNRTRALDGTQTASAPAVNVSWTYHPDNGLQAVFEQEVSR